MWTALTLVAIALFGLVVWSLLAINGRDPADDDEQAEWLREWAKRNDHG